MIQKAFRNEKEFLIAVLRVRLPNSFEQVSEESSGSPENLEKVRERAISFQQHEGEVRVVFCNAFGILKHIFRRKDDGYVGRHSADANPSNGRVPSLGNEVSEDKLFFFYCISEYFQL